MLRKMMTKKVGVSEARARLSELVEDVTAVPGSEVVIERRSRKGKAVLVDRAHYEYLKGAADYMLRRRQQPFQLAGTIQLLVSDDEFDRWLDENRKEQAELAARKFDDL